MPELLQILHIDCVSVSQSPRAPVVVQVSASPDLEVERLFKKSIKRHPRTNGLYFFDSRPKYCPVFDIYSRLMFVCFLLS